MAPGGRARGRRQRRQRAPMPFKSRAVSAPSTASCGPALLPATPAAPTQQRRAGTMQFAADTPPDTVALKSDLLKHR